MNDQHLAPEASATSASALWTVRAVREAMVVVHGGRQRPDGTWYPDTARVAARYRVSRRTVERWIAGSPSAIAAIPAKRLDSLISRRRPSKDELRREQLAYRGWQQRRQRRRLGRGRGNIAEYDKLGWLRPHVVGIYQENNSPLRRVIVTRDDRATLRKQTRNLTVISELRTRDKIDAEMIRYEALRLMRSWRLQVSSARLAKGHTQTWLASGPLLPIPSIANLLRLDEDP